MAATDLEQFVRAHATELLRSALLLSGSRDRAEDLVQETLTRLIPRWDRVTEAQSPVAYVRRSLVNRYVSQHRLMRSREVSMWDVPDRVVGADVAEDVAARHAVCVLLGTLTARQRAAVVLHYYEDLPDAEVAALLGCRTATVRSILNRALGVLRSVEAGTFSEEAR